MQSRRPHIVVVGGVGVGLRFRVERVPAVGESVLAADLRVIGGGKASNQAIGVTRLGGCATLVSAIGPDIFGERARQILVREGVSLDGLTVKDEAATMVGAVMIDRGGDNLITIAPGALDRLGPPDIAVVADAIAGADLCLVSLEIPIDAARTALEVARRHGVATVLNPAPARAHAADLLPLADYITPNETEAAALTGMSGRPSAMCYALRALGARHVALTRGSEGVVLMTDDADVMIPATPVPGVVDTSGAGDAFNAAFAVALAAGLSPLEACRLGCEAGGRIVQGPGFVEALHTWDGFTVV